METKIDTATYISGAGHLGLIGWILFGGLFAPDPQPFEVTEVSVISGAEYAALLAAQDAPQPVSELVLPEAPEGGIETPEESSEQVSPPAPEITPPEDIPDVAELPAPPENQSDDTAPVIPAPPEEVVVITPDVSEQAVPQPADRVAPDPVVQPDPEAALSDVTQEAVTQDESGDTVQEQQEATAPEEATTQIITEATEAPSAAPLRSIRPPSNRPSAPAPVAQTTQTEPVPDNTEASVNAALAEALGAGEEPAAPSGPPLSSGERESLRVAVSNCWNVGSLSSDALRTTVVIAVNLTEDGRPVTSSIQLLSSSGGPDTAATQAFGAARRAIIRCGASGYDLPKEKYSQWREIEMTFNPEGMRLK